MSDKTPEAVASNDQLGPLTEPVTLADVLDALNVFNTPEPGEDDGPWQAEHFIRVDYLPAFINIIAAAWFAQPKVAAAKPDIFAQDGRWYWVRYEGLGKTYEAPAIYRADAKAFYSVEFSGIPEHRVLVLKEA